MARRRPSAEQLLRQFNKLPPAGKVIVVLLVVALAVYALYESGAFRQEPTDTGPPGTYLFCFWNVENLYDDEDDPKGRDDMEDWFGRDPGALGEKLDRLTEALLRMNDGAGPDILAMCEVESERAVDMLRAALNARLGATGFADRKYEYSAFIPDRTGRRFAPAMISRVRIEGNRVMRFGRAEGRRNTRLLRVPLRQNGHELIVLIAHWTSRVTDETGERRMSYAEDTYGEFRAILLSNPDADVVICGDLNDEFDDPSIRLGLRATSAPDTAREALQEPRPYALTALVDTSREGTLYYDRKWQVFDHILLSRGMLDEKGWSYVPGSFSIFAPPFLHKPGNGPWDFGSEKRKGPRGYSDHFPVRVRLHVAGSEPAS
ncbi:MAG TPA: endonuclease/exonuclease/phosphatase family protein [Gemmataceae bacterium]